MSTQTYSGGCHCGAIRFEAALDLEAGSIRCNCSLCTKARAWFTIAKGEGAVKLLSGADAQTEYQWTPPTQDAPRLHYQFCKHCGVRAFGWGKPPAAEKFYFVNVAALDLSPAELDAVPVNRVNGRENRFEETPAHAAWM